MSEKTTDQRLGGPVMKYTSRKILFSIRLFALVLPVLMASGTPSLAEKISRSGTSAGEPGPAPATTMGTARVLETQSTDIQALPESCSSKVNYYVPEAPVLTTNGNALQINDQFQIKCTFKKVTRDIEWPQCDSAANTAIRSLKSSEESGSRYSGIVAIDGNTVGVASSPIDGSEFQSVKLWKFDSPGEHEISCQTDNAFHFVIKGEETYLKEAVSVDVSARSDGLKFRSFQPETAATLAVRPMPSEAMPRLQGLRADSGQSGVTALNRMSDGRQSPALADVDKALTRQQYDELKAIADAIARDDSLTPETEDRWRGLLKEFRQQPGQLDINRVIQWVLKESYSESSEDLKNYGEKVKHFNDKKKEVRDGIDGRQGTSPQQVATTLLGLADEIAQPAGDDAAASVGTTVQQWDRTVLSCNLKPGSGVKVSGVNYFEVWARNTSDRSLDAGQTISWRVNVTISSGTSFGGSSKDISLQGTYALVSGLPVGKEVLIDNQVTTGNISSCEMWAQ